jgi:hypothetical protein
MIYGSDVSQILSGFIVDLEVKLPKDLLDSEVWKQKLAAEIPAIAGEARDFWISEAGRRLRTSRREYQDAIVLEGIAGDSFTLTLSGGYLPWAVELGAPGFDMKPAFAGRIIPLNVDRQIVFTNPTFRYCSPDSKGWKHPGFEGMHIRETVIEEITEVLIPKYVQKIIEGL